MAYISVAEAAERWQLSERRVQKFARDHRIRESLAALRPKNRRRFFCQCHL